MSHLSPACHSSVLLRRHGWGGSYTGNVISDQSELSKVTHCDGQWPDPGPPILGGGVVATRQYRHPENM
jgi:hypothetical protein